MTDGREVSEYYPADTETLTIFDSASNGYRTQDIRGLENLKNLKVLDFQKLAFLKNYNFLKKITSVEELYFWFGTFFRFFRFIRYDKIKKTRTSWLYIERNYRTDIFKRLGFFFLPGFRITRFRACKRMF